MSRSRRYTPVTGITTAESEKEDKRLAHRRERRTNEQILESTGDDTRLYNFRQLSNVWSMDKDGKQRFEPDLYPELMRK